MRTKSINRANKYNTLFLYIGTFFVTVAGLSGILVIVYFLTKMGSAIYFQ